MRDFERGRPASRAFLITHNGHPAESIEIGTEEQGEIFGINPECNGGFVGRGASNASLVIASTGDRLFNRRWKTSSPGESDQIRQVSC